MRTLFNILLPFFAIVPTFASSTWTTHLAYNDIRQVCVTPDEVFVLSGGNIYSVGKTTGQKTVYTMQDGISSSPIVRLHYDSATASLMIFHQNGMLDFLQNSGISSESDLYLKEMTAGKSVNSVCQAGDLLYLAMPYGVQTFRLSNRTFEDTYLYGDSAQEKNTIGVCLAGQYIYAASDSAVYYAPISCNLVDYRNWTELPLVNDRLPKGIVEKDGAAIALWGDKLYQWNGAGWTTVYSDFSFSSIQKTKGRILANGSSAAFFDLTGDIAMYQAQDLILGADYDSAAADYWWANNASGLNHRAADGSFNYEVNSPAINLPYRLYYAGEKLFVLNGGRWSSQYNNPPYIMTYQDGVWTNVLPERLQSQESAFYDPISLAADLGDADHYWLATYGTGLYEMRGDSIVNHYNAANSPLASATGTAAGALRYTRTDGLLMDTDGTLFIISTKKGLMALRDTTWYELPVTVNGALEKFNTPYQSFFDTQVHNRIWLPNCRVNAGIGLVDYGSSVEDNSDDRTMFRSAFYDPDGASVGLELLFGSGIDHDGNVWLCTLTGLYYFSGQDDFFSSNILHRLGAIGGFADAFLKDQRVNCIAVDSLNRKWIGTDALGVYVVNAANDSVLAHFATGNSPMPSNCILSLAINPVTQEVMVGTGAGLVSCIFTEDPVGPDTPDPVDPEDPDTALDYVTPVYVYKVIRDGKILILRGDAAYDVYGRRLY